MFTFAARSATAPSTFRAPPIPTQVRATLRTNWPASAGTPKGGLAILESEGLPPVTARKVLMTRVIPAPKVGPGKIIVNLPAVRKNEWADQMALMAVEDYLDAIEDADALQEEILQREISNAANLRADRNRGGRDPAVFWLGSHRSWKNRRTTPMCWRWTTTPVGDQMIRSHITPRPKAGRQWAGKKRCKTPTRHTDPLAHLLF